MDADLRKALECLVCLELPRTEVFSCEQDHSVCSSCIQRVPTCPLCEASLNRRNQGLERVLETLPIACSYDENGCLVEIKGKDLRNTHEVTCPFRPVPCFIQECDEQYALCTMEHHLTEDHTDLHAVRVPNKENSFLFLLENEEDSVETFLMPDLRCHVIVQTDENVDLFVGVFTWDKTAQLHYSITIRKNPDSQPHCSYLSTMDPYTWDDPIGWREFQFHFKPPNVEGTVDSPIRMEITIYQQPPVLDSFRFGKTVEICKDKLSKDITALLNKADHISEEELCIQLNKKLDKDFLKEKEAIGVDKLALAAIQLHATAESDYEDADEGGE